MPHARLLHKLWHYGTDDCTTNWIQDFLSGQSQKVAVVGELSDEATITSGVPQDTVFGPVLFLCYINDLPDVVTSTARFVADDCFLYRRVHTNMDRQLLQADLDSLGQWEMDWQMEFNAAKCETLHISKQQHPHKHIYTIHGEPLKDVQSAKYLGIHISNNLSWNHHTSLTAKKANSTVGFLLRNIGSRPENMKKKAYITFVRPTVEYAATVWAPHTKANVVNPEAVQRRAARFIR